MLYLNINKNEFIDYYKEFYTYDECLLFYELLEEYFDSIEQDMMFSSLEDIWIQFWFDEEDNDIDENLIISSKDWYALYINN